jgi:hypothetical protein
MQYLCCSYMKQGFSLPPVQKSLHCRASMMKFLARHELVKHLLTFTSSKFWSLKYILGNIYKFTTYHKENTWHLQLLSIWTLSIILFLFKNVSETGLSPSLGKSLRRQSSVSEKLFLNKNRTMDDVQKLNNFINIPSLQLSDLIYIASTLQRSIGCCFGKNCY